MATDPARVRPSNGSRADPDTVTLADPLLTASDVARLLGGDFPPKTVLQLAREGRLPHLRIGKHVRFVRSEIEATLRAKRTL